MISRALFTRMADNAALIWAAAAGRYPRRADSGRIARVQPRLAEAARDVTARRGPGTRGQGRPGVPSVVRSGQPLAYAACLWSRSWSRTEETPMAITVVSENLGSSFGLVSHRPRLWSVLAWLNLPSWPSRLSTTKLDR